VTVERLEGEDAIISKGLAPGDRVVREGQSQLRRGAMVSLRDGGNKGGKTGGAGADGGADPGSADQTPTRGAGVGAASNSTGRPPQ